MPSDRMEDVKDQLLFAGAVNITNGKEGDLEVVRATKPEWTEGTGTIIKYASRRFSAFCYL